MAAVAALAVSFLFIAAAGADSPRTRVSGTSPVPQGTSSCSPLAQPAGVHNYEYQPNLAVDPTDADHLAAIWVQDFGDAAVVATSNDAGETWVNGVPGWDGRDPSSQSGFMACENGSAGLNSAHNPHIAIGKGGTIYAVADLDNSTTGDAAVVVSSLVAGATTWAPVHTLSSSTGTNDFAVGWSVVAADPHRPGVAYAMWDRAEGRNPGGQAPMFTAATEYIATTVDGGAHWSEGNDIHSIGAPDQGRMWTGGTLLVLANGTLVDVFIDCPDSEGGGCGADTVLRATSSTDGGVTWSTPAYVSPLPGGAVNRVTDAAVTPDGSALYVAWFEGWGTPGQPHLARSLDGGHTFTESNALPSVDVTGLNVAVDPDGTLGLLYYATDANSSSTAVWTARSVDHGDSFTETAITGPFDTSTLSPVGQGVGESQGFRAAPGGFLAAFTLVNGGGLLADPTELAADNPTDVFFVRLR